MDKFPETKQEADRQLLEIKMYTALDSISDIGKLFDDWDGCPPEIAEEIIEELSQAVNCLDAELSRKDKRKRG